MDSKQAFFSNYVSISSLLKLWSLEQPGSLLEMQILTEAAFFTRSSLIFNMYFRVKDILNYLLLNGA